MENAKESDTFQVIVSSLNLEFIPSLVSPPLYKTAVLETPPSPPHLQEELSLLPVLHVHLPPSSQLLDSTTLEAVHKIRTVHAYHTDIPAD